VVALIGGNPGSANVLADIEGGWRAIGDRARESECVIFVYMVDHRTSRRQGSSIKGIEVVAEPRAHFQRGQHLPLALSIEPKAILDRSGAEIVPRGYNMAKVGSNIQFQSLKRNESITRFEVIGIK